MGKVRTLCGPLSCLVTIFAIVYAYVVESKKFCETPNLMCNDDGYGTSIDRGVFDFEAGA